MAKNVLLASILVFGISQVMCTVCYDCVSLITPACEDPVNTDYITKTDCGSNTKCLKAIAEAFLGGESVTATIRTCAANAVTCNVPQGALPPGTKIHHCSFCNNDLCNSSPKLSAGLFSILPFIGAFLIAKIAL
uniref:Uncharacterized protein n=1 Tax=Lutzomyia longipalpis TaxID=7200 RepID=A0A1B0GKW2_LUTLO